MAPPNQEDPPPPPPTGHVVGSGVGIETLTEAIALGKMLDYPGGIQTIYVSGDFEIDATSGYAIGNGINTGSNILLGPNASIDITSNYTVTFSKVEITAACNAMWKTIYVQSGATLFVAECNISYGLQAFTQYPGSQAVFRKDYFLNNLFGIYYSEGTHSSTLTSVDQCTFEGEPNALLNTLSAFNKTAYAGIYIRQKPNVTAISRSIFDGVQNGIILENSCIFPTTNSQNHIANSNIFMNIRPGGQKKGLDFGNGIYINSGCPPAVASNIKWQMETGSNLGHQQLNGSTFTSNFQNCEKGIHVNSGRVFVEDNHLLECDTAIIVRNTTWSTLSTKSDFINNTIEDSERLGIGLIHNGSNYYADVQNNIIEVNSTVASTGIRVFGNNLPQRITISGNEVNLHTQGIGVEVEMARNVKIVGENEFTVTGTGYNYKCVSVHSQSEGSIINDNYFDGLDQGSYSSNTPNRVGLEMENSDFLMSDCNQFDNVATSMMHRDFCLFSLMRSNHFISGTDGYSLGKGGAGAYIGEQSQDMIGNENVWPTATSGDFYVNYDARSHHTSEIEEEFNKFWVDDEDVPFDNYLYWPDKIQSAGPNWFEADLDVIMIGVNNCTANLLPDPSEELSRIESHLVGDSLNLSYDYYNWRAAWAFMKKIEMYPELMEIEEVEDWWNAIMITPIGEFFITEGHVVQGINMPEIFEAEMSDLGDRLVDFMTEIRPLDSIYTEDSTLDSLDLIAYYTWADSLDGVCSEYAVILNDMLDTLNNRLTGYLAALNNIEPEDHFDEQLLAVMKIWVNNTIFPSDTLTSGQISTLDDLGQSCRFVDGPAVVMARSILRARGMDQPFGDHPDCLEEYAEGDVIRSINDDSVREWKIVPTITDGIVHLIKNDNVPLQSDIQIEVIDLNGTYHFNGERTGDRHLLDISGVPAGCYIVRVSEGRQPPSVIKVIRK